MTGAQATVVVALGIDSVVLQLNVLELLGLGLQLLKELLFFFGDVCGSDGGGIGIGERRKLFFVVVVVFEILREVEVRGGVWGGGCC